MFRTTILFAVLIGFAHTGTVSADGAKIKPGEAPYEDALLATNKVASNTYIIKDAQTANKKFFGVNNPVGVGTELAIELKQGQKISITATVVGVNRQVTVVLLDPDGNIVHGTARLPDNATLTIPSVPSTGTYRIAIVSPTPGGYTVRAVGPSAEPTKAERTAKIARLKKDLAEEEAALKAMEEKEKKK